MPRREGAQFHGSAIFHVSLSLTLSITRKSCKMKGVQAIFIITINALLCSFFAFFELATQIEIDPWFTVIHMYTGIQLKT
jgi:hypothetical protein